MELKVKYEGLLFQKAQLRYFCVFLLTKKLLEAWAVSVEDESAFFDENWQCLVFRVEILQTTSLMCCSRGFVPTRENLFLIWKG